MASVFQEPTADGQVGSSYEYPDETISLRGGGKLHALFRDDLRFHLTLIRDASYSGSSGVRLNSVSIEELENAAKSRILRVSGFTLKLGNVRRLDRMLIKIRKNQEK